MKQSGKSRGGGGLDVTNKSHGDLTDEEGVGDDGTHTNIHANTSKQNNSSSFNHGHGGGASDNQQSNNTMTTQQRFDIDFKNLTENQRQKLLLRFLDSKK